MIVRHWSINTISAEPHGGQRKGRALALVRGAAYEALELWQPRDKAHAFAGDEIRWNLGR